MKLKVLIIEDDLYWVEIIIKEIEYQIKKFPWLIYDRNEVRTSDRIDDSIEVSMREYLFHLAIVDYKLNGEMDGYTAVIELIKRQFIRRTKVIFHTAKMSDLAVALHTIRLGAFSFVVKGQPVVSIKKPKNAPKNMGDLPQLLTEGEEEKMLGYEIRRALNEIWIEEYSHILNNKFTTKIPELLNRDGVILELRNGVDVKKVILLSDLANSTEFLQWVRGRGERGVNIIGVIISDLLGWQADIITKHGGHIDKFYGDEVRAYFGYELSDPKNKEQEREFNNKALEASIEIVTGFYSKLLEWIIPLISSSDDYPPTLPYPRIMLHYDQVRWAIYGSESFWDFTIWTKNVTLLNRIYDRIRISKPCRIVNKLRISYDTLDKSKINYNNYLGEIYLTKGIKENLNENYLLCLHYRDKKYRNFKKEKNEISIYSLKMPDTYKCALCRKAVICCEVGGVNNTKKKIRTKI